MIRLHNCGSFRVLLLSVNLLMSLGLMSVIGAVAPSRLPLYTDWRLAAQADLIVDGRLEVPAEELNKASVSRQKWYVSLKLSDPMPLKGNMPEDAIVVRYLPQAVAYAPAPTDVLALQGRHVLAFLVMVDDGTLCFAGYSPKALLAHDQRIELLIRAEVHNQSRIAAQYSARSVAGTDGYTQRVRDLILQMRVPENERQAFTELEKLGVPAVPSIIRQMDDRFHLPIHGLPLTNRAPDAFEAIRHYCPELVVDALAAILEQITGETFGNINNGGTERQRAATVSGWRVYLFYGRPSA